MSASSGHPRRRPAGPHTSSPPPMAGEAARLRITPLTTRNLRKGATFHSPTSPSTSPVLDFRSLPRRSPTCPNALEQLIAEREERLTRFIDSIDETFAGNRSLGTHTNMKDDSSPVPDFMVAKSKLAEPNSVSSVNHASYRSRGIVEQYEDSDSGLGTSISGETVRSCGTSNTTLSTNSAPFAAITKSFSSLGVFGSAPVRALSKFAQKHIVKEILNPILREEDLKDFHPLVKDVPRRIGDKSITCLRDLEKTLLLLAPVSSDLDATVQRLFAHCFSLDVKVSATSKSSYLNFCNFTIQCIHTTVGQLNEFDLQRPTDRPYTNHYFLDLTQQIREYASMISAAKRKTEAGEPLGEMDYSPGERLVLQDGISRTGKPANFAREKNGKIIPITNMGPPPTPDMLARKRLHGDDSDSESTTRSMGRRRKSEPPSLVRYPCNHCNQDFKRQCDLSKHEKKHTRPHKCPAQRCPFHDKGFTTEKERDRHYNDKHNSSPAMYECKYEDCQYKSKRESNCKQHMEKTHGYVYVRQKTNGRNKASASRTPQTPALLTPVNAPKKAHSPAIASSAYSPLTPAINVTTGKAPECFTDAAAAADEPWFDTNDDLMASNPQLIWGPNYTGDPPDVSPGLNEEWSMFEVNSIDRLGNFLDQADSSRFSNATPGTEMTYSPSNQSLVQPSPRMSPGDFGFNSDVHMTSDFGTNWGVGPSRPVREGGYYDYTTNVSPHHLQLDPTISNSTAVSHFSPGAQGHDTLTPAAPYDEGFEASFQPTGDFSLFGMQPTSGDGMYAGELFPELSNPTGHFDFNAFGSQVDLEFDASAPYPWQNDE